MLYRGLSNRPTMERRDCGPKGAQTTAEVTNGLCLVDHRRTWSTPNLSLTFVNFDKLLGRYSLYSIR